MKKTIIIAEAGVNHCGKLSMAKKMIISAKKFGADYIKFQTFNPDLLTTKTAKLASYQKKNTNFSNQYKMLKKLTLSKETTIKIFKYCKLKKIGFLSTAFDLESAKFLLKFKMNYAKIPSGEITNFPLIKFLAQNYKKIILSTGMSNIKEIEWTMKVLQKYKVKKKNIVLLHCTSSYPAPTKELNLNVLKYFQKKFRVDVGYSDHSTSILTPIIANNLGAIMIEKHFTLNKKYTGPDHKSSINEKEFTEMLNGIKFSNLALGSFKKECTNSEYKNKKIVRKSIYAIKNIKKGEKFSNKNLITLRPDIGVSAKLWEKIIGKKAKKNFRKLDLIKT